MLPPTTTTISNPQQTKELQELQAIQALLHLVNHRNHNQHRRSKWWKELGMLRRGVRGLLTLLEDKEKKGVEEKERERLLRVRFLAREILPRCWVAFSAVVADNQYAPLGLMLIGTLARLAKVIGIEEIGEEEFGRDDDDVMADVDVDVAGREEDPSYARVGMEDVGVVVKRSDFVTEGQIGEGNDLKEMEVHERQVEGEKMVTMMEAETPMSAPKRKKKKKKKGNAIDELFKGLI